MKRLPCPAFGFPLFPAVLLFNGNGKMYGAICSLCARLEDFFHFYRYIYILNMGMFLRRNFFVLPLFALPFASVFAQDGTSGLPVELLRPQYGETPRFPRDYWVGDLGRGDASEESYQAARRLLTQLMYGDFSAAPERVLESLEPLKKLETRTVRVGGGQNEGGGIVSFLFRFLGRSAAITGELYLRPPAAGAEAGTPWRVDDIILDKERPLTEGRYSPNRADLTPYERFF
jgi:hypothetical protein